VGAPEIPTWQRVADISILLIPYIGQIAGAYEVIAGEDLFGHNLGTVERGVIGLGILLPAAAKLFKAGKGTVTAAQIAADYKLTSQQASGLLTALTKVKEGTIGHKLLTKAMEKIKAGKSLSSAETASLEKLAKEMGMTDEALAKEFSSKAAGLAKGGLSEAEILAQKAQQEAAEAASKAETPAARAAVSGEQGVKAAGAGAMTQAERAARKKMIVDAITSRTKIKSLAGNSRLSTSLSFLRDMAQTHGKDFFDEMAKLTEVVESGLQNPDLYADVLTEAMERALARNPSGITSNLNPIEAALVEMSEATGATVTTIPKELKNLAPLDFYQKYAATSMRFIDYGVIEVAPKHGAFTHMIQDLVVDRALKGYSVKSSEMRMLLEAIGQNPDALYSHTYRNLLGITDIYSSSTVGKQIWEGTFDLYEEAMEAMLQPEAIGPVLQSVAGVR
jgi:hypothetical protein